LVWLFIGLGLLAPMFLFHETWGDRLASPIFSTPFLGFIPAGVGVAYLIFYAIEGSKQGPTAP
jgi:hypothetical protein